MHGASKQCHFGPLFWHFAQSRPPPTTTTCHAGRSLSFACAEYALCRATHLRPLFSNMSRTHQSETKDAVTPVPASLECSRLRVPAFISGLVPMGMHVLVPTDIIH